MSYFDKVPNVDNAIFCQRQIIPAATGNSSSFEMAFHLPEQIYKYGEIATKSFPAKC